MKKLFVLDLDETIWHTDIDGYVDREPDFVWTTENIMNPNKPYVYRGFKRPHVDEFMDFIFEHYDVAFFTAAEQDYADEFFIAYFGQEKFDALLDRKYRYDCVRMMRGTGKPLDILDAPQALEDRILIDDHAFPPDECETIRAPAYYGAEDDTYLKDLMEGKLKR